MTKHSKGDVHVHQAEDREIASQIRRYGRALETLDRMSFHGYTGQVEILAVRVKLGILDRDESLCIVTGTDEEGLPVVGFTSALSPGEALTGALNRIENGQMKWREDEYRK